LQINVGDEFVNVQKRAQQVWVVETNETNQYCSNKRKCPNVTERFNSSALAQDADPDAPVTGRKVTTKLYPQP
jgi:hypothetical protein